MVVAAVACWVAAPLTQDPSDMLGSQCIPPSCQTLWAAFPQETSMWAPPATSSLAQNRRGLRMSPQRSLSAQLEDGAGGNGETPMLGPDPPLPSPGRKPSPLPPASPFGPRSHFLALGRPSSKPPSPAPAVLIPSWVMSSS